MLTGKYKGRNIGTSDIWRFTDQVRSGLMSEEELNLTGTAKIKPAEARKLAARKMVEEEGVAG